MNDPQAGPLYSISKKLLERRSFVIGELKSEEEARSASAQKNAIERQLEALMTEPVQNLFERREQFTEVLREISDKYEEQQNPIDEAGKIARIAEETHSEMQKRLVRVRAETQMLETEAMQAGLDQDEVRLPIRRGRATGRPAYVVIQGAMAYELKLPVIGGHAGDCHADVIIPTILRISPDPDKGIIVEDSHRFTRWVGRVIGSASYIVFFVYSEDASYNSFQTVKNMVLEEKKQYVIEGVNPPGEQHFIIVIGDATHVPE